MPHMQTDAASTADTPCGSGVTLLSSATAYSPSAPPISPPLPAPPKTSWPGFRAEPSAGSTMRPAKSTPGVAGVPIKLKTKGTSTGLWSTGLRDAASTWTRCWFGLRFGNGVASLIFRFFSRPPLAELNCHARNVFGADMMAVATA